MSHDIGPFANADVSFLVHGAQANTQVVEDLRLELQDRLPGFSVRVGLLDWAGEPDRDVLIGIKGDEEVPLSVVIDTLELIKPVDLRFRDKDGNWSNWSYAKDEDP